MLLTATEKEKKTSKHLVGCVQQQALFGLTSNVRAMFKSVCIKKERDT